MDGVKFATSTCVVVVGGQRVHLHAGDVWDATDAVVRARPELFADAPHVVHTASGPRRSVEMATAAPGEKRGRARV